VGKTGGIQQTEGIHKTFQVTTLYRHRSQKEKCFCNKYEIINIPKKCTKKEKSRNLRISNSKSGHRRKLSDLYVPRALLGFELGLELARQALYCLSYAPHKFVQS
jgi:hypothetical protein